MEHKKPLTTRDAIRSVQLLCKYAALSYLFHRINRIFGVLSHRGCESKCHHLPKVILAENLDKFFIAYGTGSEHVCEFVCVCARDGTCEIKQII